MITTVDIDNIIFTCIAGIKFKYMQEGEILVKCGYFTYQKDVFVI